MPTALRIAPASVLVPQNRPYQPFGAALDLMYRRDREVVLEGPADTGKSRACLEKLYLQTRNYPGMRGGIFRKTRASLTQTAMATFERAVLPPGAYAFHHADQEYRFPNGSTVIVGGLDDPEKIKSLELDVAYVQEVSELDVEDWEILTTRVTGRSAVMPYTQLMADMNPTHPAFWLYEREAAGSVVFLHATHADNPTITEARLAPLRALTGYRLRRLYHGERVAAEGMYFTEWDPSIHVVDPFPIPAHWTRWTATDYGYAAPFCHLAFARDPATRAVYVHRELYAAGLHDHQQAELITRRIDRERTALGIAPDDRRRLYSLHVGDPSMFAKRTEVNLPSIASVYQQKGVPLVPGMNNRKHGWSVVRRALVPDGDTPSRLRVFRTCTNLIRTLPAMVVDPLDDEDLADAIKGKKTEDHACDALRYGLVAEASPPAPKVGSAQFGG
jgi:hypothetical protein